MRRARRGSILVLSLMVVTIGALVGTSIIYYSSADRRAAKTGVNRVQARAMAWSGVQVVMAELSDQRDALLAGEMPRITERWVSPGGESAGGGERWGFRVLSVGDRVIESEMGKLDINTAPAEVLAKLPGMSEEIAGRVVSARGSRKFTSVAELLSVPGITLEVLYGGAEGGSGEPGAEPIVGSDAAVGVEGGGAASRGLSQYVTVFSFDPEVQVGFGSKASDAEGKQRININVAWSEPLGDAIKERFDEGIANGVKGLMERGEKFEKPSSIVKKLREFRVEPEGWVEVLDAFTTNPDQYRLGTVDLLTAPAVVLACIPGISSEAASEIVARREKLDPSRRATVAWPVLEDIVKPEDFELAVDHLTSRSLQWRVVLEGGWFSDEGEGVSVDLPPTWEGPAEESSGVGAEQSQTLRDRVVYEAVLDVSSLRARVAYLRDVSLLPTARLLAAADRARAERASADDQSTNPQEERFADTRDESLPDAFHTELDTQELSSQRLGEEDDASGGGGQALESQRLEEESSTAGAGGATGGIPPAQDRRVGRWAPGSGGSRE